MTDPIDDDPDIAGILCDKLRGLSRSPEREILLLIGHGSIHKDFHLRWRRGLEALAARVKAEMGFAEADTDTAMLLPDQVSRKLKWWAKNRPEFQVVAAPLVLSAVFFTDRMIPERLAGYHVRYNGNALLPHPRISGWMERQIWKRMIAEGMENQGMNMLIEDSLPYNVQGLLKAREGLQVAEKKKHRGNMVYLGGGAYLDSADVSACGLGANEGISGKGRTSSVPGLVL